MKLLGSMEVKNNILTIGGVTVDKLVEEYGTPLYVMDGKLLEENCKSYYKNFKCVEKGNRVAYAGKAFLTVGMCRIIAKEGLSLDVVSGGELFTAYKAEFPLEKVIFHGNNKTIDEIELGVKLGVGRFVVDNFYEMEEIDRIAKKYNKIQDIFLRITPGIEAHTHDYIKTGQIDSKFGFAPVGSTIMDAIKKAIDHQNINLKGIHCHIGSQIFEVEPFEDAANIMLNLIKEVKESCNYEIDELDLGGGFGIYYTEEDRPKETKVYCDAILKKVDEVCERLSLKVPKLIIEPGRSIIGNVGSTVYKIGAIKEIEGIRKYISVDGGMTDNIRPALYGAKYEACIGNNFESSENEKVTVAGKCCESGDILITDIVLPKVKSGDNLVIPSTGAYGFSMCSNYNRNPKPAVINVKDGKIEILHKRETYEDMLRND